MAEWEEKARLIQRQGDEWTSPRLIKAAQRHVVSEAQGCAPVYSPWQDYELLDDLERELMEAKAEGDVQRGLGPRLPPLDVRSTGRVHLGLSSILRGKSGRSSRVDSYGHAIVMGSENGHRCRFMEPLEGQAAAAAAAAVAAASVREMEERMRRLQRSIPRFIFVNIEMCRSGDGCSLLHEATLLRG